MRDLRIAFMRKLLLFLVLFISTWSLSAQGMVQIKGIIYDADSNAILDSVTVIVKHTSRIIQNKADGSFSVFVKSTDTLIFGLYGYKVKYMCFKDSDVSRDYFNIKVRMYHLNEEIREITINEVRTQREIRRDMNNLIIEYLFSLERTNPVQSPISYLYEKNSKKSQSKRLLVEYEFELSKNRLVYQLLDIYNKQGIIDIPHKHYRAFAENLSLNWNYLISINDYDLAAFIKQRALEWKNQE